MKADLSILDTIEPKRLSRRVAVLLIWLFWSAASFGQQDLFDRFRHVQDESELKAGETMEAKVKKNFFLRAEVSKKECFVGESIMATFKAYSRLNANSQVVKRPSLTGFSVLEMVDAYDNQPEIEKVNGKYFYAHLIRKVQLIALQPGTFQLEGAEVESVIHFTREDPNRSGIFSLRDLLRRSSKRRSAETENEDLDYHTDLETPPISVNVKPLPEPGQPADFSGAVGQFFISLEMPETRIRQHEPSIVRLSIKGSGNFSLITEPAISWPKEVEASSPAVNDEVNKYVFPLAGSKTFEYKVEARATGAFSIPAVAFSYFDPGTKTYKTVRSEPVNFQVDPGKSTRPSIISENDAVAGSDHGTPKQLFWFGGIALAIICWIIYQLTRLGKEKEPEEETPAVEIKPVVPQEPARLYSNETVGQEFQEVKAAMAGGDARAFYLGAQRTLYGAIAARFQTDASALPKGRIAALMQGGGLSGALIDQSLSLLNQCDLALYTPDRDQSGMLDIYLQLEQIVRAIQLSPSDHFS